MDLKEMREKLDTELRKTLGLALPELQEEVKLVSVGEFTQGIQNELAKMALTPEDGRGAIQKRCQVAVLRAVEVLKHYQAAMVALPDGTAAPELALPIFGDALTQKSDAPAKPGELSLSQGDRDLFTKMTDALSTALKAGHTNDQDKKKKEDEALAKAEAEKKKKAAETVKTFAEADKDFEGWNKDMAPSTINVKTGKAFEDKTPGKIKELLETPA